MPEPRPVSHPGFQGWIGTARQDITPPVGIYARSWGAAPHDTMTGVHRPLTATTLTLQTAPDAAPLVIVSLDLGWWRSRDDEWTVRGHVLHALNLPPERVLLHFTHTHAGPVLCRDDADRPGGQYILPYLQFLQTALVDGIRQALAGAAPARLEWATGRCGLAQHRDLADPHRPRWLCGFNPDGPADDTLLVGRVTGLDGRVRATLVNYACHPVTLGWTNRLLSPDWVGAMRETVETATGDAPCLFLQGASGELAPREQYTDDVTIADAQGRQIGYAVLSVLAGMLPPAIRLAFAGVVESGAPLAVWQRESQTTATELACECREVAFPLQSLPTLAELDAQIAAVSDAVVRERLARKRRIRAGVGDGMETGMPVWVWRIGEARLIAHPNEAYSHLQLALREQFPGRALAVLNVTNGHFGYLPPAALYDEDIYAVWQTPFGRGSLERLVAACRDALEDWPI